MKNDIMAVIIYWMYLQVTTIMLTITYSFWCSIVYLIQQLPIGSSGNDDVDPNAQAGDGDHSGCNGQTGALVPITIIGKASSLMLATIGYCMETS